MSIFIYLKGRVTEKEIDTHTEKKICHLLAHLSLTVTKVGPNWSQELETPSGSPTCMAGAKHLSHHLFFPQMYYQVAWSKSRTKTQTRHFKMGGEHPKQWPNLLSHNTHPRNVGCQGKSRCGSRSTTRAAQRLGRALRSNLIGRHGQCSGVASRSS